MLEAFNSAVLYAQERRRQAPAQEMGEEDPDDPDIVGQEEFNVEEVLYTLELMGDL